jgi:hypothetical protein
MSAEVFPNRLRGAGASAATVANWSANLLISVTFLSLINAIGKSWTFWLYAIFAALAIVFVWRFVPETKGRKASPRLSPSGPAQTTCSRECPAMTGAGAQDRS